MAKKKAVFTKVDLDKASNNTDKLVTAYKAVEEKADLELFEKGMLMAPAIVAEVNITRAIRNCNLGDAQVIVAKRIGMGPSTIRLWTRFMKKDELAKIKKARANTIRKANLAIMQPEAKKALLAREAAQRKEALLTSAQKARRKKVEEKAQDDAVEKAKDMGVTDPEEIAAVADNAKIKPVDMGNVIADNAIDAIDALDNIDRIAVLETVIEKLSTELGVRKYPASHTA